MIDKEILARPWWLLPTGRIHARWWTIVGLALVAAEFLVGPDSQFPILYVIPVSLAAWYSGRWPAIALAVTVPLARLLVILYTMHGEGAWLLASMTMARAVVILVMALWFARLAEHEQQLLRYVVKLEGLLPICAVCKSIRNEAGAWEPLESFLSDRSDANFTHGLCPTCVKRHY